MTSPKTLDFPLPPRRTSNPSDLRSPPPHAAPPPFSNVTLATVTSSAQQQLSRILELTNRYRTQTVTLLARQEALAAEQKGVFELERQLWSTEREIWEEERRLLASGSANSSVNNNIISSSNSNSHACAPIASGVLVNGERVDSLASPIQLNNTTRFLSVSSMAESVGTAEPTMLPPPIPLPEPVTAPASMRKRDSSLGGVRLNWYPKHALSSEIPTMPSINDANVSPKGTRNGKLDSPRYAPTGDMKLPGKTISEDLNEDGHCVEDDDEDDFDISPALLAEATKLVYGDIGKTKRRESSSSNSTTTKRPSVRRASSSIYPSSKNMRYLASFDDDEASEGDDEAGNPYPSSSLRYEAQKVRKRSASQTDKPGDQEPNVPLRLRPSSNFGMAFGSVSARGQQNLAPPPPPRQGSMSSSTFYHPETPVDSFNSQHSFRDANWTGGSGNSGNGKSSNGGIARLPDNSLGGDSMSSNRTVKPAVEPINIKSAPWGITSTNVTSPTFGKSSNDMQMLQPGLKPSPSNLTSSLSIGSNSSHNSPTGKVPIPTTVISGINNTASAGAAGDRFSTTSSHYSDHSSIMNGHDPYSYIPHHQNHQFMHKPPSSVASTNNNNYNNSSTTTSNHEQKGKTSPPTYTWTPPPPLPTSPARSVGSSRKSGMYGNTILLSPSTVAPSMKTTNPRLSAVGGIMPRSTSGSVSGGLGSPPLATMMGRMGTSSMLLSVSSRSEGGDDLDDLDDEDDDDEVDGVDAGLEHDEVEIETDDEEDGDVVEIGGNAARNGVLGSGVNTGGSGVKIGVPGGFNTDSPVEIVRDNSRWGNVLPGGMI
ncbi:hypothetical protein ABW20_dc0105284 [Dactylellina cionopaga]|nr:hypothetical protein ABW20_dc0105284 [Dactylellina cionopaga]